MTTAVEDAAQIRKTLKSELGLTSRDVSVRASSFSMGSSIDLEARSEGAIRALPRIREIAEEHERIDRCHTSGEVLSGCNRYVHVRIDGKVLHEIELRFAPAAEKALAQARLRVGIFVAIEGSPVIVAKKEGGGFLVSLDVPECTTCKPAWGIGEVLHYVALASIGLDCFREGRL